MTKLFVTAGYPGGEYAFDDPQKLARKIGFKLGQQFGPVVQFTEGGTVTSVMPVPCVRECPPDLAEWIEFPSMWDDEPNFHGTVRRRKVPGGWLLVDGAGDAAAMVFIPVAGSANLTVLEDIS